MKAIGRTLASVAAAALVSIALTGAVFAVEHTPVPTVGGTLSAGQRTIKVHSNGNVPARVTMSAEAVTLSEYEFDILPGETRELTWEGEPVGYVEALYTTIAEHGQEAGSAALQLGLAPYTPPFDFGPVAWGLLGGLAVILVLYRTKPWRFRLVRAA